jgi:ribosome maturation factor RimP
VTGDGQYGAGSDGGAAEDAAPWAAGTATGQGDGVQVSGFAEQVRAEVEPAVHSYGFALVELDAARLARRSLVRLVVYRAEAMTADDCAELARAVRYRLALVPGAEDARLEVTTPGTSRQIKAPHEYAIFRGRTVSVLVEDDWLRGVIVSAADGIVTLHTGTEERPIELRRIRKGRLSEDMIDRNNDGDGTDVQ